MNPQTTRNSGFFPLHTTQSLPFCMGSLFFSPTPSAVSTSIFKYPYALLKFNVQIVLSIPYVLPSPVAANWHHLQH